jgi:hypothetical protein
MYYHPSIIHSLAKTNHSPFSTPNSTSMSAKTNQPKTNRNQVESNQTKPAEIKITNENQLLSSTTLEPMHSPISTPASNSIPCQIEPNQTRSTIPRTYQIISHHPTTSKSIYIHPRKSHYASPVLNSFSKNARTRRRPVS